jgi:hypothetical protein
MTCVIALSATLPIHTVANSRSSNLDSGSGKESAANHGPTNRPEPIGAASPQRRRRIASDT